MQEPTLPRRYTLEIDARDVLAGIGCALVLAGAAAIHWALALVVLGLGLVGLAWRLTTRP
jgi:hypothetical protein